MKRKRLLWLLPICVFVFQTPLFSQQGEWQWWNDLVKWDGVSHWSQYLKYCPKFFGPNAFPVPAMTDGTVPDKLQVDVAGEQYFGFGDNTTDLCLRIDVPLYPDHVALSLWMVPVEYYHTSDAVRDERHSRELVPKGYAVGDLYVQTAVQILRNRRYAPDIMIAIGLKTASGSPLDAVRYYDTPGYFFDATIGKRFSFKNDNKIRSLAVSGKMGFLCWQTMQRIQDDAVMYGLKLDVKGRKWGFEMDWSGYVGWAALGDKPMIVRGEVNRKFKTCHTVYVGGLIGLHDYPFYCVNAGYRFSLPLPERWLKKQ